MAQHESSSTSLRRLTLVSIVVIGLFAALSSRLWFLQVLAGERYSVLAERNAVRFVVTEAPRGSILDREGRPIAKDRPALTVSGYRHLLLDGAGRPKDEVAATVIARLSQLLAMSEEEIVDRLTSHKYSPFRAVPIVKDVPPEVVLQIKEHRELYPGVEALTIPVRDYPERRLAAHALGYVGEISDEELTSDEFRGYQLGDIVGKDGLEKTYERHLQGDAGLLKLEVNARGTEIRELGRRDPVKGDDLVTTLDLDVQRATERALRQGLEAARRIQRSDGRSVPAPAGAAVLLDVRTGGVVAMASYPTYDPAVFLGGISQREWQALQAEQNHRPLLNRAIVAEHPPGSTFKPVTAAAAMDAGVIGPSSQLSCPGSITIGRRWRNWTPRHEGSMDVARSLMRSCDTFYYQIGHSLFERDEARTSRGEPPLESVQAMARRFGLGERTGIDVPGERPGTVPGRAFKQELVEALTGTDCVAPEPEWECTWRYYDAVNMSIGQGLVTTTPLQIATAYAAIANGGTAWRPHLGLEVRDRGGEVVERIEPEVLQRLDLSEAEIEEIQAGLEMVVLEPRGTASFPFGGFPLDEIPVAGKTGTAESNGKVPFAWFAAYAPVDEPRYAVAVMIEEGSSGSGGAAPVARRILEAAFDLEMTPYPGAVDDRGE